MALRLFHRFRTPLTAVGGALVAVVIVLLYLHINPQSGRYSDNDIRRLADERIKAITPTPPPEPEIYAMLRPSVVQITRQVGDASSSEKAIGAGVVVDESGSILTANHVIAGSDTVNVRFYDGTSTTAKVVHTQPDRDLAIVQVRRMPKGVTPAVLAGGVREGDKVLAVGSPFGLDGSVTDGIVSGLHRSTPIEETGQTLDNLIQFDAAVNPGSSGGPLVDYSGHVVGIVSGIINPTPERVFIGIGFAVPIESASGILPPLG